MDATSKGRVTSMSKASGCARTGSSLRTPTTPLTRNSLSSITSLTNVLGQVHEDRTPVRSDRTFEESLHESNRRGHRAYLLAPHEIAGYDAEESVGDLVAVQEDRGVRRHAVGDVVITGFEDLA